ncbi:hypothetical protein FA13DRAFT_1799260 [Coprinellus micaceus]|uniref:Uncharacterized protein n=1 Tax=Coprinellus micaceus TaxID=71717 RepID=A0A4Y7SJV7_COPMI|nr:hypothetical protein FA13DRAFT_1799260 [Coprinellus micaceus]
MVSASEMKFVFLVLKFGSPSASSFRSTILPFLAFFLKYLAPSNSSSLRLSPYAMPDSDAPTHRLESVPTASPPTHVMEKTVPFSKVAKASNDLYADGMDDPLARLVLSGRTEDSSIGFFGKLASISSDILIPQRLTLDTTCTWKHSLTSDVHVFHSWDDDEGDHTKLVHQMSGFRVGTFNSESSLYIVLPHAPINSNISPRLTSRQFRDAWDLALGPAVEEITSSPYILPEDHLRFAQLIRTHATSNHLHWFREFVFVHVIRDRSSLHFLDEGSKCSALKEYLERYNLTVVDIADHEDTGSRWFIEVGLVITHQQMSVVWSTADHASIVRGLFGVDYTDEQYQKQLFAHLTDASCARISCYEAAKEDPSLPTCIELEVTDKKSLGARSLGRLFDKYASKTTKISAIVTATIRIQECLETLVDFNPFDIFAACITLNPRDVWLWLAMRVRSVDYVLELLRLQAPRIQGHLQDALPIAASGAWIVSSLHRATVDDLPTNHPLPISSNRGAIFLPDIELPDPDTVGGVPRFRDRSACDHIDEESLVPLLGSNFEAIRLALAKNYGVIPTLFSLLFRCGAPPVSPFFLRPSFVDPDLHDLEDAPDAMNDDSLIATFVNTILGEHFFSDILQVAPAAVRPLAVTHTLADRDFFLLRDLGGVFHAVRWKHASMSNWQRSFRRFFPTFSAIKARNCPPFYHFRYFQLWIALSEVLTAYSFAVLRRAVWSSFFKDLVWIPSCSKRCVWATRRNPLLHGFRSFRSDDAGGVRAAEILINAPESPLFTSLE